MTDCNCDPPADEMTTTFDEDSRVIVRIGSEVGSIETAGLEKVHREVANLTGLPTAESYHDRRCKHGRAFTEVVVFPDRSVRSPSEPREPDMRGATYQAARDPFAPLQTNVGD